MDSPCRSSFGVKYCALYLPLWYVRPWMVLYSRMLEDREAVEQTMLRPGWSAQRRIIRHPIAGVRLRIAPERRVAVVPLKGHQLTVRNGVNGSALGLGLHLVRRQAMVLRGRHQVPLRGQQRLPALASCFGPTRSRVEMTRSPRRWRRRRARLPWLGVGVGGGCESIQGSGWFA